MYSADLSVCFLIRQPPPLIPAAGSPAAGIGRVVVLDGWDDRGDELQEQHHVAAVTQTLLLAEHKRYKR